MIEKFDEFVSNPEKRAYLKLIMQGDFRTYLDIMFYYVNDALFVFKPFHDKVISKLQNIADCKNTKRNLCLNVPVGAGKSIIIEYFISWCFARSINNTFCYVSHSDRLITRLSKETKEIVENKLWQKLFNVCLKSDDRSKVNWSFDNASNRTGLTAGTMGGSLTGLDAGNPNTNGFGGALIIDDPIDADNVKYPTYRESVIQSYDNKLSTRRRTPQTPTILIMQRLHLLDLTGWVLNNEPEDWDVCIIPAVNEEGQSFWVEKFPLDEMEKIKKINPPKYAAQYQQKPIVIGGEVIKTQWFKYYQHNDKEINRVFITADTAQKTAEHNDYTVFCVWGVTDTSLRLLDMLRGKWESPELKKNAYCLWSKWQNGINGCPCNGFYIEDKVSGTGLIQDMQRESALPVIPIQRTKDKLTRLEDALPYIESGRVELPIAPEYSFNPILITECESFARDMSHQHDDIIDNLCDGINIGLNIGNASIYDSY